MTKPTASSELISEKPFCFQLGPLFLHFLGPFGCHFLVEHFLKELLGVPVLDLEGLGRVLVVTVNKPRVRNLRSRNGLWGCYQV